MTRKTSHSTILERAGVPCPIYQIFGYIALLRRGHSKYYKEFDKLLHRHYWYYLHKGSERVLVSLLDTICDGDTHDRHAALTALTVFRDWHIVLSAYEPIKTFKTKVLWGTIETVVPRNPDFVKFHFERLRRGMAESPIVWMLFHTVYERIVASGNCPIVELARITAGNIHFGNDDPGGTRTLAGLNSIITPTTINPKYKTLYAEYLQNNRTYGNRTTPPAALQSQLTAWGTKSLLNFGAGNGLLSAHGIAVTNFEPALDNPIPKCPFDALCALDVLEHVPEKELRPVMQWLRLWSGHIWLKISTRLAAAILPNGENAHATVRPAGWWVQKLTSFMPDYNVTLHDDNNNQAIITCVLKL